MVRIRFVTKRVMVIASVVAAVAAAVVVVIVSFVDVDAASDRIWSC